MRRIALIILAVFTVSIFSDLLSTIRLVPHYSYASESYQIPLKWESVAEPIVSTSHLPTHTAFERASGIQRFAQAHDMFVLRIPRPDGMNAEDIHLSLSASGIVIPLEIDSDGLDGDPSRDRYYYTEPVFLDPTDRITYRIETRPGVTPSELAILSLDTRSSTMRLAIGAESASATSDISGVISRSEWGADETLRYTDHPTWKKVYEEQAANANKPKSDATLAYEKKVSDIRAYLATKFPDQDTIVERISSENGHDLVWPVEKTRRVEKIVIHHTADENRTDKDDLSMIRGIYYYHTMVRGWGDIGYHYLVGQRGQIYEGRAGGDYAVSAHALWNNKSTVGVSVMGNFMHDTVVAEQETGIRRIVGALAEKYGIDIHKTSTGHRECATKDGCLLKDFDTPNLLGHRDVGYTSCPGDNLYALVGQIRADDTATKGFTYKENPRIVLTASDTVTTPANLPKWPTVKIRLSYQGTTIRLKSADSTLPRLTLGNTSGTLRKNLELTFAPSGSDKITLVLGKKQYPFATVSMSANLMSVPSWSRKPAWDSTGTYNDNVFRGKITLLNEGGKLVVVNELPLEDYLRGLAEVSNGDNTEKMKTIIVAARAYAYFYSSPSNRKFPGKYYDGSDNPDEFQKYLGYGYELRSPNTSRLVDETNGQIITYNGTPIKPWYFNESDGRTRSAKEYCEAKKSKGSMVVCEDIPYLQSVSDPGGVGHTLKWHGVGISGIGATYLATTLNFKYDQIIEYYLTGTKVEKKY